MPFAFVITSTVLQAAGFSLLAWKLVSTGLFRTYKFLTALAICEAVRVSVAAAIPRGSDLYGQFYFCTQPVLWILSALVTLEVYSLIFRSLPGIADWSRRIITAAVGCAGIAALLSLFLRSDPESPFQILESYLMLDRAVNFSLLSFVVLLILVLSWYPVRISRNALIHSGVFSFYFGTKAIALLIRTWQGPGVVEAVNYAVLVAGVGSLLLWIILLSTAGETVSVRSGYKRSDVDEDRLMAQLEAINSTLLRSAQD